MKNYFIKSLQLVLIVFVSMILIECSSYKKLINYTFKDHTASAIVTAAPWADVFTDSFIQIDKGNLFRTILNVGSTIVKEVEAGKVKTLLDSAMKQVNVPERIKNRTLEKGADFLHYRPIQEHTQSDYMFDIHIKDYGIDAKSWDAGVYFRIDIIVNLIDNRTGKQIWKKHVQERKPMSRTIFSLGGTTTSNIINAIMLSNLSVEEMIKGFQYLADYTADRIIQKLQKDYAKSRAHK